MTNQEYAKEVLKKLGEYYTKHHGYGIVPPESETDEWAYVGFREIAKIEERLGRKLTEKEWYDMSIR